MSEFRKEKRRREARQKSQALELADNPLADEVVAEVITEETKAVEETEKCHDCYSYPCSCYHYEYYGGAISFAELDAYLETKADVAHFESITYQFKSIIDNILFDDRVGTAEKAGMISAATEVYKMKLTAREKGMFGKFKEYVAKLLKDKKDPSNGGSNSLEIITQKDGSKRWFGRYSNNYMDREQEIVSEEAHKEFVAYLKQYPDRMPAFWSWHIPGTSRAADADYIDYIDGFMIASGPLTAEEADQLSKSIEYDDGKTGMSHGMFVLERDPGRKEIITKYRSYEISDLPLANAANGFTSINSTKEVKMTDEKFNRLAETIGEKEAKKIFDQIGDSKETLEALGIESKESEVAEILDKVDTPAPDPVDEEKPEDKPEDKKEVSSPVQKLAVAVGEELGLKELSNLLTKQKETIEHLTKTVAELTKEEDEKIAEQFVDKSLGGLIWKEQRASESEATELDETETEKVKTLSPTWISEELGVQN